MKLVKPSFWRHAVAWAPSVDGILMRPIPRAFAPQSIELLAFAYGGYYGRLPRAAGDVV